MVGQASGVEHFVVCDAALRRRRSQGSSSEKSGRPFFVWLQIMLEGLFIGLAIGVVMWIVGEMSRARSS